MYYNQSQREAILDASKIAGYDLKDMVNENTAVSTCYAIDNLRRIKSLNVDEFTMFFDIGYSSASVSIVKFNSVYNIND